MNKKTAKYIIASLLVILPLLVISCGDTGSSGREPIRSSGTAAPDFTAQTIDGETITLSDYKGKKAVIVDIWATWCGPCQMEMPELQKIYEKHSDKLEIIAASQDRPSDIDKVKDFVKEKNITFKIIFDQDQAVGKKFPTRGIPFLVIIDKQGNVVKRITGYSPDLEKTVVDLLDL